LDYEESVSTGAQAKISIDSFLPFSTVSAMSVILHCRNGHFKINRVVAPRFDQFAESSLGMLYIATAHYWNNFFHAR
jgi:hypothetical protein